MKKWLISILLCFALGVIPIFGQTRLTVEQVDSLAREYPQAVYCLGEYREISYEIDEGGYVWLVRFETMHKSRKFAREDFKRSLEYFREGSLEEWKISKLERVIYLEKYFVYLTRDKDYVKIEFCRNPDE